jgi:glycosyltransferase involved in cell wall biosynthesis
VSPLPVSVVIPAYRRPDAVRRAVASVLAQSAAPAEVIVVDDASGDGTAEAAREAGATVVVNETNRGEGGARNAGIAAAGQAHVALLDSDDEWLPGHLEGLVNAIGEHVLAGAGCLAVGPGAAAGRIRGWPGPGVRLLRSPLDVVWPENMVTPSGVLLRRDALLAAGGFAERMPHAADLDTWLRLLEHGTGVALPRVSVLYHLHGTQASADREAMVAAKLAAYDRYRDRPWFDPRLERRMRALHAWDDRATGRLVRAVADPQGAVGLLQTWSHRRRKRAAGRRWAHLAGQAGTGSA